MRFLSGGTDSRRIEQESFEIGGIVAYRMRYPIDYGQQYLVHAGSGFCGYLNHLGPVHPEDARHLGRYPFRFGVWKIYLGYARLNSGRLMCGECLANLVKDWYYCEILFFSDLVHRYSLRLNPLYIRSV
jgi:hypothetical protein